MAARFRSVDPCIRPLLRCGRECVATDEGKSLFHRHHRYPGTRSVAGTQTSPRPAAATNGAANSLGGGSAPDWSGIRPVEAEWLDGGASLPSSGQEVDQASREAHGDTVLDCRHSDSQRSGSLIAARSSTKAATGGPGLGEIGGNGTLADRWRHAELGHHMGRRCAGPGFRADSVCLVREGRSAARSNDELDPSSARRP